jgi:hypothetical protein
MSSRNVDALAFFTGARLACVDGVWRTVPGERVIEAAPFRAAAALVHSAAGMAFVCPLYTMHADDEPLGLSIREDGTWGAAAAALCFRLGRRPPQPQARTIACPVLLQHVARADSLRALVSGPPLATAWRTSRSCSVRERRED